MAGNGPDPVEDLVDHVVGLDIEDDDLDVQFQANRETFQGKVGQRFNVDLRLNTPYQEHSYQTLTTDIEGEPDPNQPNKIEIDLANDVPETTNKDMFAALQQHRRHPDWKDKELVVQQNIGGRVEEYILAPSEQRVPADNPHPPVGQIFLQRTDDRRSAPKYPPTVQRLDAFAELNGGNQKRQEMASMMLEAIRNPQNEQPDFGQISTNEAANDAARKDVVDFILMSQITEAVPPVRLPEEGKSGRTPGMDAYTRSALQQIVESNGEITFRDIHDHGIVTGAGGTQAGRNMANPDISHDDLQLPDDVNGILRPDERGLFRNIVDDMSDDEQPQQPQPQPPPPQQQQQPQQQ